jgi:hypothetical protein
MLPSRADIQLQHPHNVVGLPAAGGAYWLRTRCLMKPQRQMDGDFMTIPNEILKARLAAGEISIDEYREILAEISTNVPKSAEEQERPTPVEAKIGGLIFEFEHLRLFENAIIHENVVRYITDVTSVDGGQYTHSTNSIPSIKITGLTILFASGESINLEENRKWFGGKRHQALLKLLSMLREVTFKQRMANLTRKLRRQGQLELTRKSNVGEIVLLRKDGIVIASTKSVNLKVAKASGTFELGTHSTSLMTTKSNPFEIVLSEKSKRFGRYSPSDALTFVAVTEDLDILRSLIAWMAEPGNKLD